MNKPSDKTHFALDTNAPLSAQQKAEIAALNAMPDETIDYSDIPPLNETFWQNAKRNPFNKQKEKTPCQK